MARRRPPVDVSLFRMMAEQVRDYALFLLDPQGNVMTWNLGAQQIKGYTADDIIGRHFSTFYPREALDRGWPEYELKVATAEGRFEDEGWRVRKDGSRFWASVVITALRDPEGKLLGFSKITRDVSERRLHEEALRQSEERFRLLVEGVEDYAIYMLDPEGIITSWNAGAQRIKGYRRDEIVGKHFSRFFSAEDIEAGRPWEELATARRDGRWEGEGWRVKKDGERFWARVVVTVLLDADGRQRGFAKVTQDLTERRERQALEQAAGNVNEFIAMLAHELRNPLAPIRTAVQVMDKLPADDPAQVEMRRTIDRQGAQLERIVDDMLDIARITRGTLTIEHLPLNVADVIRRAVETATPSIQAAQHGLEIELPEQPVMVQGDAHRLTQLLTNLLNNAARYTPQRGRIGISARGEGNWAVVRVRDTGRGIERDIIGRIFDMFVQGRPPLQRVGGGLGVGLALARRIAEMHGGTLEAKSEGAGKGSEFTLRLPLMAGRDYRGPQATATPEETPVAKRILVVDDNVDAAGTLDMLLRSLGHETRVAYEGAGALKIAADFMPDIVLLDIGMPGLDGYEVARRLRALQRDKPFRIIAVTGWGQQSDREKSQAAGFDVHLVKPVDPKDLIQLIAERDGRTLH
jgi:PAS domain S-box-containing protein